MTYKVEWISLTSGQVVGFNKFSDLQVALKKLKDLESKNESFLSYRLVEG